MLICKPVALCLGVGYDVVCWRKSQDSHLAPSIRMEGMEVLGGISVIFMTSLSVTFCFRYFQRGLSKHKNTAETSQNVQQSPVPPMAQSHGSNLSQSDDVLPSDY